jgi:hypothetical protein
MMLRRKLVTESVKIEACDVCPLNELTLALKFACEVQDALDVCFHEYRLISDVAPTLELGISPLGGSTFTVPLRLQRESTSGLIECFILEQKILEMVSIPWSY